MGESGGVAANKLSMRATSIVNPEPIGASARERGAFMAVDGRMGWQKPRPMRLARPWTYKRRRSNRDEDLAMLGLPPQPCIAGVCRRPAQGPEGSPAGKMMTGRRLPARGCDGVLFFSGLLRSVAGSGA